MKDRRIVIVGFMGCGKTTVAKALAARLECGMVDLDGLISTQQRMSVPELINQRGEAGFRDAETFALQIVLDHLTPRIIALGGGAWTLARNRDLVNTHGCISVFLDASFNLCWQRITGNPIPRPLALDEPSAAKLFRERHSLYALADVRIDVTEELSVDDLAAQIVQTITRKPADC